MRGIRKILPGTAALGGVERIIRHSRDALALGVNMIHQEFANFPHLSVAENIYAGTAAPAKEPRPVLARTGSPPLMP